jgi:arylformamidase
MTIYDVTVGITNDMPVWPGDPAVSLERVKKIEEGANANASHLSCGVHIGTHVDAPLHFIPGQYGVDQMPLDVLVGPALLIELPDTVEQINADTIKQAHIPANTTRVLFKTRNSSYWSRGEKTFQTGFCGVEADAAKALVDRGVKLVGIDYLSVAPYKRSRPTHEALLGAKMVVIEGMDFSKVKPGVYQLCCLPLKLVGTDGAPARTILIGD